MPADASKMTDDAAALLSVWVMVKDGGTWGAPGPPPWVVNKISRGRGTLVAGELDEQTSAAFRDAGITIGGPDDGLSAKTAHALLDEVADEMGVAVAGALREFLHSQEMAMTRLAEEVQGLKDALEMRHRQMGLATKYIGRYYELMRDIHDPTALTDVRKIDEARQMVFAIGADLKRILEEKDEADHQNDLGRSGGYAKGQR